MGLDYILNIYWYSESHASCEANHQVKQNNKCQAWRRCVTQCLQPEISSFLLSRVDVTGLQIINSTTSHAPRLVFTVQSYLYL